MKSRKASLGAKILAFLIGMQLFSVLYQEISALLLYFSDTLLNYIPSSLQVPNFVLLVLTSIFGGMFGLKCIKTKNWCYEIFIPRKSIIFFVITTSVLMSIYSHGLSLMTLVWMPNALILIYLFACLGYYFMLNIRRFNKKTLLAGVLCVLMFPMVTSFAAYFNGAYVAASQIECGVIISDLSEDSPLVAYEVVGKRIESVNGRGIASIADYVAAIQTINGQNPVQIGIDGKQYTVNAINMGDSSQWGLGIKSKQGKACDFD